VSDRALQDDVIRALADAPYRKSAAWRTRGLADPDRVERFARFLARHFYHERVVHFFKYSRALARVTGRMPDAGAAIRYLGDLLQYEAAMMVVEAGPRIWREDPESGGEGAGSEEWSAPETVEGTVLLELAYDLPVVLPELLRPWSEVPQAPARSTKLLVARSPRGRVAVARSTDAIAALLGLADGRKTLAELAHGAGLEVRELEQTLHGLVELGAVRFSTGS